jgi:hypothetical protein
MSHSFLPWMRHWARMVNNNRYGLLIKEHGRITRASSRLRSAPLRFAQCRSAQRLKRIPLAIKSKKGCVRGHSSFLGTYICYSIVNSGSNFLLH